MPVPLPNPRYTPLLCIRRLSARWLTISLALHAALIAAFLINRAPVLKATQLPGDSNGHQMLLTYLPGGGSASIAPEAPQPVKKAIPDRLPSLTKPKPTPSTANSPTNSAHPDNSTGTDTLGAGDIQIASVLMHPPPHPDLNALPSGTRGDVIVDIVIDNTGHIASYTLSRGLGHGVDDAVLATIRQWTFQPATRNGIPVASEQELLFHYERG